MPRWLRIIRGMIGMGVTFAAGVGVVASAIVGLMWLLPGGASGADLVAMAILAFKSAMWAFPIGVAFSGTLLLVGHRRRFDRLSLPMFAALGSGAGLLLFGLLSLNAWHAWSISDAIANAVILVSLGGASATGTLWLARRAGPAIESADEPRRLREE